MTPERARALYRAYLEAGGPGRIDRRGNFSMLIAQLGHIGEDACARWLDPGESEAERERQEARVEEFVTLPLTTGHDRQVAHRHNLLTRSSAGSRRIRFCPMQHR